MAKINLTNQHNQGMTIMKLDKYKTDDNNNDNVVCDNEDNKQF